MTWVDPDDLTTPGMVRQLRMEALLSTRLEALPRLRRLALLAAEASVTPSRSYEDPDDPGIRSQGGPPSDPTWAMASDDRRRSVGAAMRRADGMTVKAIALLMGAESTLNRALSGWEG